MEHVLIGLSAIVVLGVAAQWISWRLRLPSILFLLVVGFLAGPIAGFIDPDQLLGDLLFPIVSLSVAIILFEGGLSLNIAELRESGRVVWRLVTLGALLTWAAAGVLAFLLLDFELELAALFGAILVVTGPTVIGPLLRHIRPDGRVGAAVKWEGIVNDPIGAILAVLVFEVIVAGGFGRGVTAAGLGVLRAGLTGAGLGLAGAAVIVLMISRHWIPDFLQNPVALGVVLSVFTGSNVLQQESGLLAVTIMGSALASQDIVTVRHIVEFKENLRVLLLSTLFIVLAARLPVPDAVYTSAGSYLFLAGLVLLVRPAAVAISTWGTAFSWRERAFLALMAPRGIVAAAVASLFALRLAEIGYVGANRLLPLTFLVIVGTVAAYGLAAPPLARWLGVATPNPQGMILVGAESWVREVAKLLVAEKVKVVLVDSNWANVAAARREGLKTHYLNILSEHALQELDLDGVGRLLALTPNDEVNTLAALRFDDVLGRSHVFQLPPEGSGKGDGSIPKNFGGRLLFHRKATHHRVVERYAAGAVIKKNKLTEEFGYDAFRQRYGEEALPMFLIRESGQVALFTPDAPPSPKTGQILISLVDEVRSET